MRVRPVERHEWRDEVLRGILALQKLPERGDRFAAARPTSTAVARARYLLESMEVPAELPLPLVFPTLEHGIRLEWRGAARELEFEVLAEGAIEFLTIERGSPGREGKIDSDELARNLISWLRG